MPNCHSIARLRETFCWESSSSCIRGDTLRSMLPMLRPFPTFFQARGYMLLEEASQATTARNAAAGALLAAGVNQPTPEGNGDHTPSGGRGGHNSSSGRNTTNSNGDRNRGGRRRGGSRDGPVGWIPVCPPWGYPWAGPQWRAPWTGATGPGILGTRPAAPVGQAYPTVVPLVTAMAPVQSPAWDTSGLIHALNAVSLH